MSLLPPPRAPTRGLRSIGANVRQKYLFGQTRAQAMFGQAVNEQAKDRDQPEGDNALRLFFGHHTDSCVKENPSKEGYLR
jgi:hypothetical protein